MTPTQSEVARQARVVLLIFVAALVAWLFTRQPLFGHVGWLAGVAFWLCLAVFVGEGMSAGGRRNAKPIMGAVALAGVAALGAAWWFLGRTAEG